MEYFYKCANKIFVILNYRQRQSNNDAMVSIPLNSHERQVYKEFKKEGKSDSAIYRSLFFNKIPSTARAAGQKVNIEIGELGKKQLVYLITRNLKTTFRSLARMTIADLRKMFIIIKELKKR